MPTRPHVRDRAATAAPTWDQMVQELAGVGVPTEQARLYVQLVRRGPSTASELAQLLGLSRPQTYRILEALSHDAFVTPSVGRPRTFTAGEPASVLQALRDRTERALAHIDRVQALLTSRLEALRSRPDDVEAGPQFAVLRGADAVSKTAQDVCRLADERIDVLVGPDASAALVEAILHHKTLAAKADEGVGIRVLAPPRMRMPAVRVERRDLPPQPLASLLLADGRDALLAITAPARGRTSDALLGVRTNARPFVATQSLLFERLWQDQG